MVLGDTLGDEQSETYSDDLMFAPTGPIAQYYGNGNVCDSSGNWYTEEVYLNRITPRKHGIKMDDLIPNDAMNLPVEINESIAINSFAEDISTHHHEIANEIVNEDIILNDAMNLPVEINESIANNSLAEGISTHHHEIAIEIVNEDLIPNDAINLPVEINESVVNNVQTEENVPANFVLYECPILGCPKEFKLKYSVKRHVEQFHGGLRENGRYCIKKFVCAVPECSRRCLSKNNVKQHYEQQHGKNPRYTIDYDDVEPLKYK